MPCFSNGELRADAWFMAMVAVVSLVELMRKETNLLGIKFKSCGLR